MNIRFFVKIIVIITILISIVTAGIIGGAALAYKFFDEENEDLRLASDTNKEDETRNEDTEYDNNKVQNVMLLAVDAEGYRTDVIILAQYNFETQKVNMLQIPRDTMIETDRWDKKINAAYAYDKEEGLFDAVKKLLGVKVDKYILVNIDGFRDIIDEIGGVEMYVPINMYYDDPYQNLHIDLKKGHQVLYGKQAEMFVRFRKNNDGTGYPNGDIGRIEAQQEFIKAAIDKMFSIKNVLKIPKMAAIIIRNVKTNFGVTDLSNYIEIAFKMDKDNINIMKMPGKDGYVDGRSYIICDKEKTKEIIEEYFTPESDVINQE